MTLDDVEIFSESVQETTGQLFDPEMRLLVTGRFFGCEAQADDGDITFTRIDPQVSTLLGLRYCKGAAVTSHRKVPYSWEEAAVLVHRLAAQPRPIRIKEGEAILIRLAGTVEQSSSNGRAYCNSGDVRERYVDQRSANTESAHLLDRDVFVLVKEMTNRS